MSKNYKQYPLWYKIAIYGMYSLIALMLVAIYGLEIKTGYYNLKAEILDSEHTIRTTDYRIGKASWYDYKLLENGLGVVCNMKKEDCYTETKKVAASRDFPRGTLVGVCRVGTDRCVDVIITDYIEHPDRIIDLSSYAFSQLEDLRTGIINVSVTKK